MANQVLIVAGETAARTPAEVARSLRLTPVITGSEQEAVDLLRQQRFRLIAVSGKSAWQRVRDAAESKQPMTRVLELPEVTRTTPAIRRLMVRYLDRSRPTVRVSTRRSDIGSSPRSWSRSPARSNCAKCCAASSP